MIRVFPSRRRVATVLSGLLLAIPAAAVPTGTAHAAFGDMLCVLSSFQVNYTPPLTGANLTTPVYATGHLANCVSLNGNYTNLLSANIEAPGVATAASLPVNPCYLVQTINGTGQFVWTRTDGSHVSSTIAWVINLNPFNGPLTLTATITGGPMAGDIAIAIPLQVNPNLDCLFSGLRTVTAGVVVVPFG